MIKYAGIGSRETPLEVRRAMYQLAYYLAPYAVLRSGRARGADTAFEDGARAHGGFAELFTAEDVLPLSPWYGHAASYHPAWKLCSGTARALHARNSAVVLGPYLIEPVKFIACWTRTGKATGGTGQALRIAADPRWSIPVFNFHDPKRIDDLYTWLKSGALS